MQARGVEYDPNQVPEAILEGSDRLAERAIELDLAGRHGAGAELVLKAPKGKPVRCAVDHPGDHEQAEPLSAGWSPLKPCADHEQTGVGHRTEPLLAADPVPTRTVRLGHRLAGVQANVGASLHLGDELGGMEPPVVVDLQQRRQVAPPLVVGAQLLEQLDRTGGAGHGTGVSRFAVLVEEVGDGAAHHLGPRFTQHRKHAA